VYAAVFTHDASLTLSAAKVAAMVEVFIAALVTASVAPITTR